MNQRDMYLETLLFGTPERNPLKSGRRPRINPGKMV